MDERRAKLETEYLKAIYKVFAGENEIVFRVGENSEAVNQLLDAYNAKNFAFITAYNPRSKILPDAENISRLDDLKKSLHTKNIEFLEGHGANEKEIWQPEKSLFIFDISRKKSVKVGREFEQNAIIYGERYEEIKLIWCSDE